MTRSSDPVADANALHHAVATLTAPGQQFELTDIEAGGLVYRYYRHAPPSLRELYEMLRQHGDADFIVYGERRLSFNDVYSASAQLANALRDCFEVQKGDRVAIAMRNNPEWCIAYIAITAIGAVAVPLNSWWTGRELDYALDNAAARVAVIDPDRLDRLLSVRTVDDCRYIEVGGAGRENSTDLAKLLADRATTFPPHEIAADDPAMILYTSGSTGNPKGALSTHRGILTALMSWALQSTASGLAGIGQDLTDSSRSLAALVTVPLFHVSGTNSLFLMSVVAGRKMVLMYKWDVDEALRLIEKERITHFNGVPTMSQELVEHPHFADFDTSSLNEVYAGGAARPPHHVKRIGVELGFSPGAAYGLTETSGLGCVITGQMYIAQPASVGVPTPAVTEIRIVADDGTPCEANVAGEIQIRSPANIVEYWRDPEATKEAFVDGWLKTGDVGYLDENGFLFIVDRIKDIIVRGGENISCLEVEAALCEHPSIAEAAVFGLPDARLGEIVVAQVAQRGTQAATEAEVLGYLAERLAAFKIPERIEIIREPLPRTSTGKIFKREIRESFLQRAAC